MANERANNIKELLGWQMMRPMSYILVDETTIKLPVYVDKNQLLTYIISYKKIKKGVNVLFVHFSHILTHHEKV
jgi:hypothetical protein